MFLVGLAIILFSLVFSMLLLGGHVLDYVDIPSLVLIIFSLLGVLGATRSLKVFYTGFKAVIFPKKAASVKSLRQAASLFRLLSKTMTIATAAGVLVCLVNVFKNLGFSDARGAAMLGIPTATAFMLTIYGLFFVSAVFEPMVFILKKRLMKSQNKEGL